MMLMTKAHGLGPVDMPASVGQLPHGPGVYRFVDANNRVLYVGRALDLRRRAISYWGGLRERQHLQGMVSAVARVQAVLCASEHEAAWLERNLLETHKPRANRTRGGQEVPTLIALSVAGAAPGLKAVHSPCHGAWQHFGPYLGGDRVRLALAGLHRAYPLPYSGDGLTGSERDMARARGLTSLSRADLLRAISAVLAREPLAVAGLVSELKSHRDRAAMALAFELARRVQDEIVALDWLLSPQRVTPLEPYELDAYGWHQGLLVHFSIRDGRLSTWRQSAVSARHAERLTDATPEGWAEFAQENAVLAARLAGANGL
jgi:excinuclease ABC subunit C